MDTPASSTESTVRRPEFLTVIIPTRDEARRIGDSLAQVLAYLRDRFREFEILVADNGSVDDTVSIATSALRDVPNARVMSVPGCAGKGCAVRAGMLAARGDFVLFCDADLSTPMRETDRALDLIAKGADVVIGSRALPESDVAGPQGPTREVAGRVFNRLVRGVTGLPYADTQCGFKCFRRKAAEIIFSRARIDGFGFDVEVLVLARAHGLRTIEMPVRWVDAPGSKVRLSRHASEMLLEVLRVQWNATQGHYRP